MEYSSKLTKSGSTDPASCIIFIANIDGPTSASFTLHGDNYSRPNFSGFCHAGLMSSKQISRNSKSIGEGLSSASTKTVHFRVIMLYYLTYPVRNAVDILRGGEGGVSKITVGLCW